MRGFTLSPVISKLFEMVLLSRFKDDLISDPLQFGFKAKSSCSHAIFTVKTVIDYYVKYKLLCPRGDTNLRAGRGQHRPSRILARCRKTPYPARLTEMEK